MNRKEILNYIEYKGEYTKEVKKKLNKLIKKYHPDKQKKDKDTILELYKIKQELEKGIIKEFNKTSSETTSEEKDESINNKFIERMINILKSRKNFIEKELQKLYKKSYYYSNKIYEESYEKGLLDIKIEEISTSVNNLKKLDIIDTIVIALIIMIILISRIINNNYLLIFIIFPVIYEYIYYKNKKSLIEKSEIILEKVNMERKVYIDREKEYNKNINELEKEEVLLEKEIRSINNDIAYYNHELSKSNTKNYNKERVNDLNKQRIKK